MANKAKQSVYVKVAGLTYIIIILLGIFSVNVIESNLIVPGNNAATFRNIVEHKFLFRIGVTGEVLMYLLVILLSSSLFIILRTVDKNLAMLALLMRVAEAIIGAATVVLSGLIPLHLITIDKVFPSEQIHTLLRLFLDIRGSGLDIVLMFIGVGGSIFCYLFYKSNYVPKFLAGWGIFTYLSMLFLSFASLISPDISETFKMVFYIPGGLFELIFGFWLL
ncbi:DUF4386 domain-containing protein, partial [bacterium BMS3Abin03]|nr:DUF4386 domain-containing protein [bacterium BMS3Abin03]